MFGKREYVALVMPMYDGDLRHFAREIKHGRVHVSSDEQVNLIKLLQEGLNCMYAKKLCYTDIKPDNVLFKRSITDPNLIGISIGDVGPRKLQLTLTHSQKQY
jgi:hypothetical protein